MPSLKNVSLNIAGDHTSTATENAVLKEWGKTDGMQRAMLGGLFVLLVAGLMIPIPIVHFVAIPVVLIGFPVVTFAVFRLYSKGTDIEAEITCPDCGLVRKITRSVQTWPVTLQCLGCQKHLTITTKE